ncbi:hypothetical protein AAMO2058_000952500 [Amorphochlora amoebiformis]
MSVSSSPQSEGIFASKRLELGAERASVHSLLGSGGQDERDSFRSPDPTQHELREQSPTDLYREGCETPEETSDYSVATRSIKLIFERGKVGRERVNVSLGLDSLRRCASKYIYSSNQPNANPAHIDIYHVEADGNLWMLKSDYDVKSILSTEPASPLPVNPDVSLTLTDRLGTVRFLIVRKYKSMKNSHKMPPARRAASSPDEYSDQQPIENHPNTLDQRPSEQKHALRDIDTDIKTKTEEKTPPTPCPDEIAKRCYRCHVSFGIIFPRKHHCRECGKIFCHACSPHNLRVDGYPGVQRVCKFCAKQRPGVEIGEVSVENTWVPSKEHLAAASICGAAGAAVGGAAAGLLLVGAAAGAVGGYQLTEKFKYNYWPGSKEGELSGPFTVMCKLPKVFFQGDTKVLKQMLEEKEKAERKQ